MDQESDGKKATKKIDLEIKRLEKVETTIFVEAADPDGYPAGQVRPDRPFHVVGMI